MSAIDLQTVMHRFLPQVSSERRLSDRERQVCAHIRDCRTAAMGTWLQVCTQCPYQSPRYLACRDRHCPKCQGRACATWCAEQSERLLPVTYYHVVFTLPHELNDWVQRDPSAIYRQLFESVWATLAAFGGNPKRLGGQLGATLVLHTWGQTLTRHVHLHALIPGGALSASGHWRSAKGNHLFPVRALSRHVRGHFVSGLRRRAGTQALAEGSGHALDALLTKLMQKEWVVYARPCLGRAETVVAYLSRYSHRTALTDSRLVAVRGDRVGLRYRDYRDGDRDKVVWLEGAELVRRFLLHVLPKGLMRIRHYGFLANRCRAKRLAQIRADLQRQATERGQVANVSTSPTQMPLSSPAWTPQCPRCRIGHLRLIRVLAVDHAAETRRLDGG